MRRAMQVLVLVVLVLSVATAPEIAHAQRTAPSSLWQGHPELALEYSYVRSNAPPGGCTCFNINGGSATFAWPLGVGKFALIGDVTAATSSSISSSDYSLTLSTFSGGMRYRTQLGRSPLHPFGEVLAGVAHASGSLVESPNPGAANASAAFAGTAGGGIDLPLRRHVSVRLVEADYLVTTFQNGVNDHQNNLRLSAGLVLHF